MLFIEWDIEVGVDVWMCVVDLKWGLLKIVFEYIDIFYVELLVKWMIGVCI